MAKSVNKIKNAHFAEGKVGPSRWVWNARRSQARWRRLKADEPGKPEGVEIVTESERGEAFWSQSVACARDKYLRLDAVVTCDLSGVSGAGGLVLTAQAFDGDDPVDEPRSTPPVLRADEPVTVRTFFRVPAGAKQIKIAVGVTHAKGVAVVHAVRAMPMIEPEEASHMLAIPPPPYAVAPRTVARRITVCSSTAKERRLTTLLREALGSSAVSALDPGAFDPKSLRSDALLIPDETPPRSIRTLKSLFALAEERMVVLSLSAFASLTGDNVKVRRVEQEDDPLCARIGYAGSMTRGFALDDTFTFGWEGSKPGGYVHRQFVKSVAFTKFIKKHGFETLLVSMGNTDATSDRPIALYRPSERGGLYVLDLEPIERPSSTMNEPVLLLHLLLSMLGHGDTGLGQYMVPAPTEAILRELFREAYPRFREFIVHDADVPASEVKEQLVTIGRGDESFGLPLKTKPLILVRSGLMSEDAESVYGCFLWFKQLIRMVPYPCPYAGALASRFRFAWVPSAAPWGGCFGWRRRGAPPHAPMQFDVDDGSLGVVIDVVSKPINRVRVVLPERSGSFDHLASWFPRLAGSFGGGRFFAPCAAAGADDSDRAALGWRFVEHAVEVCVEPDVFQERALREAAQAGAAVVRIEAPGFDADFPALSIHRTNVVATALEHVIGLYYGLIAVNRHLRPVHFDGFAPLAPGESLILDRTDRALSSSGAQAG